MEASCPLPLIYQPLHSRLFAQCLCSFVCASGFPCMLTSKQSEKGGAYVDNVGAKQPPITRLDVWASHINAGTCDFSSRVSDQPLHQGKLGLLLLAHLVPRCPRSLGQDPNTGLPLQGAEICARDFRLDGYILAPEMELPAADTWLQITRCECAMRAYRPQHVSIARFVQEREYYIAWLCWMATVT